MRYGYAIEVGDHAVEARRLLRRRALGIGCKQRESRGYARRKACRRAAMQH